MTHGAMSNVILYVTYYAIKRFDYQVRIFSKRILEALRIKKSYIFERKNNLL